MLIGYNCTSHFERPFGVTGSSVFYCSFNKKIYIQDFFLAVLGGLDGGRRRNYRPHHHHHDYDDYDDHGHHHHGHGHGHGHGRLD